MTLAAPLPWVAPITQIVAISWAPPSLQPVATFLPRHALGQSPGAESRGQRKVNARAVPPRRPTARTPLARRRWAR